MTREDTDNRPFPKAFVLELTRRCNNNCGYCYNIWRAPECAGKRQSRDEMLTREIRDIIVRLQEEPPVAVITLNGEEPMLRPDLHEIIEFIRFRGIRVLLLTNGALLTEERVKTTVKGTIYQVPLLSCHKETHDRMAGRNGAGKLGYRMNSRPKTDLHLASLPPSLSKSKCKECTDGTSSDIAKCSNILVGKSLRS